MNILVIDFGQGASIGTALTKLGYTHTILPANAFKTAHLSKITHIILSDSQTSLSDCVYMLDEDDILRIVKSGKKVLGIGYGFHLLVYYLSCKFAGVRRIPKLHRDEIFIPNKLNLTNPFVKYSFNHADYVSNLTESWDIIDYIGLRYKNETMLAVNIARMKRELGVDVMGIQFNPEAREKTYSFFKTWSEWP